MNARTVMAASAILAFCCSPALAGARDDALNAVAKCASLTDDHARLACYDAAAAEVKSAIASPAESQPPTAEEQKSWFGLPNLFGGSNGHAPQTTPKEFGNESLPPPPPPPPPAPGQPAPPPPPQIIDSITAGVTDYAFNPYGKVTVFLDNGQIWKQIEGDDENPLFAFKKSKSNTVTISRGLLGSYNMQVNGKAVIYKMRRLK